MQINKLRPTESIPAESRPFTTMRRIVMAREKKMQKVLKKEIEEQEAYRLQFYNTMRISSNNRSA